MNVNGTATIEKKPEQTGKKPKETKRSYPFPLPMDEACDALMKYVTAEYGNKGTAVSINIVKGDVVITIEP